MIYSLWCNRLLVMWIIHRLDPLGAPPVNHAMIAAEALRYRLKLVKSPLVQSDEWKVEELAVASVTAADPEVDGAIRRIAESWVKAGLEPTDLCVPWSGPLVDQLFEKRPDLVDALDDILRGANRASRAA